MIHPNLADFAAPMAGLIPGARAELVAVSDDHAEALALAQIADRPAVIELAHANTYGLFRVFSLRGGGTDRRTARLPQ